MADRWITIETRAGAPVQAGNISLIPLARSMRIQLPGTPGGLVWNRPVSVVATGPGGRQQVLPVLDVTRRAQLVLLGAGLLGSLLLWLTFGRRSGD
jgi:hypothetical protein